MLAIVQPLTEALLSGRVRAHYVPPRKLTNRERKAQMFAAMYGGEGKDPLKQWNTEYQRALEMHGVARVSGSDDGLTWTMVDVFKP